MKKIMAIIVTIIWIAFCWGAGALVGRYVGETMLTGNIVGGALCLVGWVILCGIGSTVIARKFQQMIDSKRRKRL